VAGTFNPLIVDGEGAVGVEVAVAAASLAQFISHLRFALQNWRCALITPFRPDKIWPHPSHFQSFGLYSFVG
jgi:hypothetical protein